MTSITFLDVLNTVMTIVGVGFLLGLGFAISRSFLDACEWLICKLADVILILWSKK